MPKLGKRKHYIGVSVLGSKRPGRKELPAWYWQEGNSWHSLWIYKTSLYYDVQTYCPSRGQQLWAGRHVDETVVLRLVSYLAAHNITVTEQQLLLARNIALQGKTVIMAPVDRTKLKIHISDLEGAQLQLGTSLPLKIIRRQ